MGTQKMIKLEGEKEEDDRIYRKEVALSAGKDFVIKNIEVRRGMFGIHSFTLRTKKELKAIILRVKVKFIIF